MAYTDSASLAADTTFQGRVRAAVTKKALNQLASAYDGSVRFQKRTALARRILDEQEQVVVGGSQTSPTVRPPNIVYEFCWALATNNPTWTTAAQPSDNQLDSALTAAIVDAIAGVTANE